MKGRCAVLQDNVSGFGPDEFGMTQAEFWALEECVGETCRNESVAQRVDDDPEHNYYDLRFDFKSERYGIYQQHFHAISGYHLRFI